jgi:hypothetical protein
MALKALGAFQLWTASAYGKSMVAMWQKNVTRGIDYLIQGLPKWVREP